MRVPAALRELGAWVDVVALLAVAGIVGTLSTCATGCKPSACSPQSLAQSEAAYVAEMLAACEGRTRATCPAASGIEAKYAERRKAWIRCQ